MKIALVGGIGYMGGRLADYLRSNHHHVRVTTRRSLSGVPPWVKSDQVVHDDLTNVNVLRKHLGDRDVIIYLASPDEKEAERDPRMALRAGTTRTSKGRYGSFVPSLISPTETALV